MPIQLGLLLVGAAFALVASLLSARFTIDGHCTCAELQTMQDHYRSDASMLEGLSQFHESAANAIGVIEVQPHQEPVKTRKIAALQERRSSVAAVAEARCPPHLIRDQPRAAGLSP